MLGSSQSNFSHEVKQLVDLLRPASCLELGCGEGKLLLENPSLAGKTTAIQKIFKPSDSAFLNELGYKVIDSDILNYYQVGFDENYDLIVAMDVIEHFMLSDAFSIIDFSLYRSAWVLLVWPSKHPQNAVTSIFDRHRCSFSLRQLTHNFDVVFYRQSGFASVSAAHLYHLALLRGHMNLSRFG